MTEALPILSPVERNSVADQVAKKILDLVRTGNLKPGDQLPPERDLAQMLQVSRPSLREAMRGLQILGVVKTRQGGGAYISSLDAADLLGPLQFLITLNTQNVHALYEFARADRRRHRAHGGGAAVGRRHRPARRDRRGAAEARHRRARFSRLRSRIPPHDHGGDRQPFPRARLALALCARHGIPADRLGNAGRAYASRSPITRRSLRRFRARDADAAEKAMVVHMRNVHRSTLDAMGKTA